MMPNYRRFDVYRFSGEEDAAEGAVAIGKIEASIPSGQQPIADLTVQFRNRRELIEDWWQKAPAQSIAWETLFFFAQYANHASECLRPLTG